MADESTLSPCPFCGQDAEAMEDTDSDYREHWCWVVCCTKGEVVGPEFDNRALAIGHWNKRTSSTREDELLNELDELSELAHEVAGCLLLENMRRPAFTFSKIEALAGFLYPDAEDSTKA